MLPFQAVHIFRPSFLLGKRMGSTGGEPFVAAAVKIFRYLCVGPLRRYRPISAVRVGQAMVAATKAGKQGANVYEYDEMISLGDRFGRPANGAK